MTYNSPSRTAPPSPPRPGQGPRTISRAPAARRAARRRTQGGREAARRLQGGEGGREESRAQGQGGGRRRRRMPPRPPPPRRRARPSSRRRGMRDMQSERRGADAPSVRDDARTPAFVIPAKAEDPPPRRHPGLDPGSAFSFNRSPAPPKPAPIKLPRPPILVDRRPQRRHHRVDLGHSASHIRSNSSSLSRPTASPRRSSISRSP